MGGGYGIGRRAALAGLGAAGGAMLIRAQDARAQGVAMTYVAPFSFIMAFADVLHASASHGGADELELGIAHDGHVREP